MFENQNSHLDREIYDINKVLNLSQDEVLALAVKVVVDPNFGWLTAALIIYGCKPIETISLKPSFGSPRSQVRNLSPRL